MWEIIPEVKFQIGSQKFPGKRVNKNRGKRGKTVRCLWARWIVWAMSYVALYKLKRTLSLKAEMKIITLIFFFFELEFCSCCPCWSAVAQSQLTATSASWVQVILLPQASLVGGITGTQHQAQLIFCILSRDGFHHVCQSGLELLTWWSSRLSLGGLQARATTPGWICVFQYTLKFRWHLSLAI